MLHAQGLVKQFKRRVVVKEVDLELNPGEVVGLLGPNGAGKTTTFRMIVGLLKPDGGSITFNGLNITKFPMYKRARAGMAYLPQEASVFRRLTVRQNIMAVLEHVPMSRANRKARADELLEELKISHLAAAPAYTLSGGERRRTEIARALVAYPKVFLLDEPFAGIDPIAIAEIQEIVHQLREANIGVLITDHQVRETLAITDRAYIIGEGKIIVKGTPQEIADNPIARKTYLGEGFQLD